MTNLVESDVVSHILRAVRLVQHPSCSCRCFPLDNVLVPLNKGFNGQMEKYTSAHILGSVHVIINAKKGSTILLKLIF